MPIIVPFFKVHLGLFRGFPAPGRLQVRQRLGPADVLHLGFGPLGDAGALLQDQRGLCGPGL